MKDFNCSEDTRTCLFYGLNEFIKNEFDSSLASALNGQVIVNLLISKNGKIEHLYFGTITRGANSKFLDNEAKIKKEMAKVLRRAVLTGKAEGDIRINSKEFMFQYHFPFKFISE